MANVVKTFGFTGASQSFAVPDQVTQLVIECWGAWGAGAYYDLASGGPPSYIKGTVVVSQGQLYYIYVGGGNGWNGGGSGGSGYNNDGSGQFAFYPGGNGGGATDIRYGGTALSNRILVAAGGGGNGGNNNDFDPNATFVDFPTSPYPYTDDPNFSSYENSGMGMGAWEGSPTGGLASNSALSSVANTAGHTASTSAGGAAGASAGTGSAAGTAGASGVGGNGGSVASGYLGGGGGGGGGGYYGGGGGASGFRQTNGQETFGGGGGAGTSWASSTAVTAVTQIDGISLSNAQAQMVASGFCQISYVQPPTIPTPTITTADNTGTPGEYDVTQPIEFAWQFGSLVAGESQTRFDIQYSSNGGTSWTEISEPNNTSQTYTFPADFFTAATTYDVQVRVYDKEGMPSGWSASVVFEAVSLPGAPTITAPVAGSNIDTTTFTVSWTIPSGTQSDYWVQIYDAAGNVLIDTGTVASATESYSATLSFSEAETVTIAVRYQTTTSGGVWSTIATETAFLNLDPPATPVVNIGTDDDGGTISLDITNPAGAYATIYNDVYRTDLTNGTPEIRIATGVTPNSVFTDYTPASGIYYQYRVRAYSASGGVADAT